MSTAADRVAAFVAAFLSNETRHGFPSILTIAGEATNHKDMSLDANDVAELVAPSAQLLLAVHTALAALPSDNEDTAADYSTARAIADTLDEAALFNLAVALNEARLLVMAVHREKHRETNLNNMYARAAKENRDA